MQIRPAVASDTASGVPAAVTDGVGGEEKFEKPVV